MSISVPHGFLILSSCQGTLCSHDFWVQFLDILVVKGVSYSDQAIIQILVRLIEHNLAYLIPSIFLNRVSVHFNLFIFYNFLMA